MKKEAIIGAVLFISILVAAQAHAYWGRTEVAYWGASGTAYCYRTYQAIPIRVGLRYMSQEDALAALWQEASYVCRYRGGLKYLGGENTYSRWVPTCNGPYWPY
ncbi:MAG: hypothetical protein D3908_17075 [Candidatus Electrothrix sp. AUS4]|nr:hypothetical protein [Candidatus Electrothrix sp. AUS4]